MKIAIVCQSYPPIVMEAIASGLPVVTVYASFMTEFVIDGETGYLVPPEDTKLMAARLISLVKNHRKSVNMGQVGRIIAETHTNQRFLQQHEALYESILHISKYSRKEEIIA